MTATGVIILLTQILPSLGYYPKEDIEFVNQFKPQAEEAILENILKEEAGEGVLVLEDFKETIDRAEKKPLAMVWNQEILQKYWPIYYPLLNKVPMRLKEN